MLWIPNILCALQTSSQLQAVNNYAHYILLPVQTSINCLCPHRQATYRDPEAARVFGRQVSYRDPEAARVVGRQVSYRVPEATRVVGRQVTYRDPEAARVVSGVEWRIVRTGEGADAGAARHVDVMAGILWFVDNIEYMLIYWGIKKPSFLQSY